MKDLYRAKLLLQNRKNEAEKIYAEKMELLKSDKDFFECFSRVSALKFEFAKREVFNIPIEKELLDEYENKLKIMKSAFKKANINENNIPDYSCQKCLDTGFIGAQTCDCLERARLEINFSDYKNLKRIDRLSDINFDFYGEEKENYKKRANFIKKAFMEGDYSYCVVVGAPGTGKTYLAESVVKEALLNGKSIKIISAVHLNKKFLEYHLAPLSEKNDMWEEIAGYDYMLIDDLGVEAVLNNVTLQYLYELLVERIDKKTIITSNLDIGRLENKYGQRIASRLMDKRHSAVFEVTGRDYRNS